MRLQTATVAGSTKASEERYRLVSSLRVYDELPLVLAPYLSAISQPRFRSEVVNTDDRGFRFSWGPGGVIESDSWGPSGGRGLVLGGSFVFGIGATHDRHTLVSALNSILSASFLNLGIRAGNSLQEFLTAIPFMEQAEVVIVCSGLNNLLVSLQSLGTHERLGPLFAEEAFEALVDYSITDLASVLRASLDRVSSRVLIREIASRARQRLSWFAGKRSAPEHPPVSPPTLSPEQVERATAESLRRQGRDLVMLRRSLPRDATLIFAAQPFADATSKARCPEEMRLFRLADDLQGRHWQIMKTCLTELWPRYVARLRLLCESEGIPFTDLNALELEGWCYVDRAHMTDHGYRQVAHRLATALG